MTQQMTSAQANKLLRRWNEELDALAEREEQCRSFLAALGEDVESVRPAYDFTEMQEQVRALEARIRRLKHAINHFNVTTEVPGFGMTVDALLILIPQLTRRRGRLSEMRGVLPKVRESVSGYGKGAGVIDYRYANYDVAAADAEYAAVSDELARAQTALDTVNNTVLMTVEL